MKQLFLLLLLLLPGCGGGSSTAGVDTGVEGNWAGTFSNTRAPQPETGAVNLIIASDGAAHGTFDYPGQPSAAPVTGEVASDGATTLTATMPQANGVAQVPFTLTGTLTPSATALTGTLAVSAFGSYQYDQTLTLSRQ